MQPPLRSIAGPASSRRFLPVFWLAALAAVLAITAPLRGSSIPIPYYLPVDYTGSGSAFPAQAAPGAGVVFRAPVFERYTPWYYYWQYEQADAAPWSYQWYFNGQPIPGAKSWKLTLTNLSAAHSGIYAVRWSGPGFPGSWDYFPLTVAAPPATPVEGLVTTQIGSVNDFEFASLRAFPGGRVVVQFTSRNPNYSAFNGGSLYCVLRPDGSVEDRLYTRYTLYMTGPVFMPSGRYLWSDHPIPGLAALLGAPGYAITAAEEVEDGKILLRAQGMGTFGGAEGVSRVIRVNADFTLDATFDPADFALWGRAVAAHGRYLEWEGGMLLGKRGDGTVDPSFRVFAVQDVWPDRAGVATPVEKAVYPQDDGTLLVHVVWPGEAAGTVVSGFVRLQSDGSIVHGSAGWAPGRGQVSRDGYFYQRGSGRAGIWRFRTDADGACDPTFYAGVESTTGDPWDAFALAPDGRLLVVKRTPAGTVMAYLRTADVAAPSGAAVVAVQSGEAVPGQPAWWRAVLVGDPEAACEWVALDGAALPADHRRPELAFPRLGAANVGTYVLRVTSAAGSSFGPVVRVGPTAPSRLAALSGRGVVDSGEDTMIVGWIARTPAMLLSRAVGPGLESFGVGGLAQDPRLTVMVSNAPSNPTNDNWTADLAGTFAQVGAFPLTPGSRDAALVTVAGTIGTVHAENPPGRGVVLVELYDASSRGAEPLALQAISLRGQAGAGAETLIGGFVVEDASGFDRPVRLLLRVVGPTLGGFGITRALEDPVLRLFDARGALVAENDNWEQFDREGIAADTARVGLSPLPTGSRDAALRIALTPGAYTIHAGSATGTTGVALIEIYRID